MAIPLQHSGYSYQRVNSESHEIRTLTLFPGTTSDDIRCTLETASLDINPSFEALSYVWGDTKQKRQIFLGGFSHDVTTNLEVALRHLRYPDRPRILWVDALCICQADLEERSQQVSLMGQVYSSAKEVLIWLGEAKDDSDFVFECIEDEAKGKKIDIDGFELNSYFKLMGRPWFRRVWVVQEAVLPQRDPIIGCGKKWIPWSIFKAVPDELRKPRPAVISMVGSLWKDTPNPAQINSKVYPAMASFDNISILRYKFQHEEHVTDLVQLLNTVRDCETTDPRDFCYGMLGMLASSETIAPLVPDYRKPLGLVYHEATSAHITSWFKIAELFRFHGGTLPQPSWVPDFSKQARIGTTHLPYHFRLGKETVSGSLRDTTVELRTDGVLLEAKGLCLDVIDDILTFGMSLRRFKLPVKDLEELARSGAKRKVKARDRRFCFAKYRSRQPLWRMFLMNSSDPEGYRGLYEAMCRSNFSSFDHGLEERQQIYELNEHWDGRAFFRTQIGLCGTAVADIQKDDVVAILLGGSSTFVLRPKEDYYVFIGQSCVSGIMDGQLIDELVAEGKLDSMLKTFVIR